MKTKMNLKQKFAGFALTTLFTFGLGMTNAHAQDHHTGGGSFTEMELKSMLQKLAVYVASSDGRNDLPELKTYDQANPKLTVADIAKRISPHLVDYPLYVTNPATGMQEERDCVSTSSDQDMIFACNRNNLPSLPDGNSETAVKSEFYQTMYRLALHEVLVQTGLEDDIQMKIPSDYPISSKLSVHLELNPEWFPGSRAQTKQFMRCLVQGDQGSETYDVHSDEGSTRLQFNLRTPGLSVLAAIQSPDAYDLAGDPKIVGLNTVRPKELIDITLGLVKKVRLPDGSKDLRFVPAGKDAGYWQPGTFGRVKNKDINVACALQKS